MLKSPAEPQETTRRERMERYLMDVLGCSPETAAAVVNNLSSPPSADDLASIGRVLESLAARGDE